MKAKDFLEMLNKASENAEVKVENGEIVIADPKPFKYKFNVGDKVVVTAPNSYPKNAIYEIVELKERDGEPLYEMKCKDGTYKAYERYLKLATQDITERIKTFDDAYSWCIENGYDKILWYWNDFRSKMSDYDDIEAYLKLRIITCALNEGWEPTFAEDEERWRVVYDAVDGSYGSGCSLKWETTPNKLIFKSNELASYAAEQFSDIYSDFCGCKKGSKA